jgi:hypothetical protein
MAVGAPGQGRQAVRAPGQGVGRQAMGSLRTEHSEEGGRGRPQLSNENWGFTSHTSREQYKDSEETHMGSVGQYGGGSQNDPSNYNWIDLDHVDANQPTHWQTVGSWNSQTSNATSYIVENEQNSQGMEDDDNMNIGLNLNGKYFYQ